MSSLVTALSRFRRRLLVHRRGLAALAAGSAVFVALQATAAPPPPSRAVWVAGHDLPGGTVVRSDDLRQVEFNPDSVPPDAITDPTDAVGRTLAAPLTRGETLTIVRLVDTRFLTGYPGLAAVPVRITDAAVVGLLRVGDRITLVATDPSGRSETRTIAEHAPVMAIPRGTAETAGAGLPGRMILVGIPLSESEIVASAGASEFITAIWTR